MKDKQITIYLDPTVNAAALQYSREKGVTFSELVSGFMKDALDRTQGKVSESLAVKPAQAAVLARFAAILGLESSTFVEWLLKDLLEQLEDPSDGFFEDYVNYHVAYPTARARSAALSRFRKWKRQAQKSRSEVVAG